MGHFLQKSPIIDSSFAERDLQLRQSMHLRHPVSDEYFAAECRSFSSKEPYNEWLFCGKRPAIWATYDLNVLQPNVFQNQTSERERRRMS